MLVIPEITLLCDTWHTSYIWGMTYLQLSWMQETNEALNMAYAILNEGQDVFFTSDSYKPHVDYVEGSYSLLVQHFVREHGEHCR